MFQFSGTYSIALASLGFLCFIGTQAQTLKQGDYYDEAGQIFTTIFHKYNERINPVKDVYPKAVPVNLELTLVHVLDMDDQKNVLDSIIDLRISWLDPRLFWYAYIIKHITVNISTVWAPDVPILNIVAAPQVLINPRTLVVNATGDIFWYQRLRTQTLCEPSDSMVKLCSFKFGSRQLTTNQQDFGENVTFDVADEMKDSPWKPTVVGIERHTQPAYHQPLIGNYSEVHCLLNVTAIKNISNGASSRYMHVSSLVTFMSIYGIAKFTF
ncbi:hypothetical protein ScPMuIL_007897 [Solemya velum]